MSKRSVKSPPSQSRSATEAGLKVAVVNLMRACDDLKRLLNDPNTVAPSKEQIDNIIGLIYERAVALEKALDVFHRQVEEDAGTAQRRLKAREREIERLKSKLDEQISYRARMNRALDRSKQEVAAANAEVAQLRGSYAFRAGSLIVAAVRNPRALLTLPIDFIRLARELWPRVKQRLGGGGRTLETEPDLGPAMLVPATEESAAGDKEALSVPRLPLGSSTAPELPDKSSLRIATILDDFSYQAFSPCGNLRQLRSADWKEQVDEFRPHLLLVESAWKGERESWARKVYPLSEELKQLIGWCRKRAIPTVFWNKEDPVHLSVFLPTARLFDFVFTTDIDCVRTYKAALGHDQVFWLPFGCQPELHNPIETYDRKDRFCFAGSYYAKYPERQADFEAIVRSVEKLRPVEIFDRNAGGDDPGLKFPETYESMIQGVLPYSEISRAYKGYQYGININTVKQSQSMFARRAFELLASNTVTVSNYSRGLRMLLGDLVISSDDGSQILNSLRPLADDEQTRRKFRLAGLRAVMSEHTYQDRLDYVIKKVSGKPVRRDLPEVLVFSSVRSRSELGLLIKSFESQTYDQKTLLLVVPDQFEVPGTLRAQVIKESQARKFKLKESWPTAWAACMRATDYYGPNYLLDLVLATRYARADVIGKAAYFRHVAGANVVCDQELAYQSNQKVAWHRAIVKTQALPEISLGDLMGRQSVMLGHAVSIDEFNYCSGGAEVSCDEVNDLPSLWTGVGSDRLHRLAETATAADALALERRSSPAIDAVALANILPTGEFEEAKVSLRLLDSQLVLRSTLPANRHAYLYSKSPTPLDRLFKEQVGKFNFVVETDALVSIVFIFLSAARKRIGHAIRACGSNLSLSAPAGTAFVRLGIRVQGAGVAKIKRLVLGHLPSPVAGVPGQGQHLVITRGYPAYDDLYSYAYVHTRLKGYEREGLAVDVFRLSEEPLSFREFEGIDVVSGQLADLELALRSNPYRSLMVHSLDRALWAMLREFATDRKIYVWIHGAEIQPWYRRDFSFVNARDLERGIQRSNDRMDFWRGLFAQAPENVRFVFVSQHLAREAMRDIGVELAHDQYHIIHNYIDTELFKYHPKPAEQRKRILSVRPYSRPTYANDLTVRAILDLEDEPYFSELEFRIIGDGRLFDETVDPVRHLHNVVIEKRFLTQQEIAELHREYGVFLVPSRIDSQGVSRDEAMSSGLVPITNRVSAIPEFVDGSCGYLADPEDWKGMADAIRDLYRHPEKFVELSAAAARRVRNQSAKELTLGREISLMRGRGEANEVIFCRRGGGASPITRPRIAVYGDLDLNVIDGSSIWAASLARVLAGEDAVDVDLFLKAPVKSTTVIKELLGLVNVRLMEPPPGMARRSVADAVDAILEADVSRKYGGIVIRGFKLAQEAVSRPGLASRLWVYLTDVPHSRETVTPEFLTKFRQIAARSRFLLCQTPQLRDHLSGLAPEAMTKMRLLPPMIPDNRVERTAIDRGEGEPLRIAYAGKFAPGWGVEEMFTATARLKKSGLPLELHIFGDKVHNPADDPGFRQRILDHLEGPKVVWYRGLDRREVLERLRGMDIGWAWRSREIEENTLELSTKVLEYASCGAAPLVAKGVINCELLGPEYPLYADTDTVYDVLRGLVTQRSLVKYARDIAAKVVSNHEYASVRKTYIEPLLTEIGEVDGVPSSSSAIV